MAKYSAGDFVLVNQRQYLIKKLDGNNNVLLEDTFTKAELKYTKRELNDSIFMGTAELVFADPRKNELNGDNAKDFYSYSDTEKQTARDRLKFVRAFHQSGIKGISNKKPIRELMEQVATEEKLEAISYRTLKRFVDDYEEHGIKGLIPQTKKKGNRTPRKPKELEELIIEALEVYQNNKRPKFSTAHEYLCDQIETYNDKVKNKTLDKGLLPTLSYPTFINRAKK